MNKENLINKIASLEIGGENKFVVRVDGHYYEFKVFQVAGDTYKAFGGDGFGYALRVFNPHDKPDAIAHEFINGLRGLDLSLEFATFQSPLHFA